MNTIAGIRKQREPEERGGADERGGRETRPDLLRIETRTYQSRYWSAPPAAAPGDDTAEGVPDDLCGRHAEPLPRAQRDALQAPRASEARDLGHEHHREPDRLEGQELWRGGETFTRLGHTT